MWSHFSVDSIGCVEEEQQRRFLEEADAEVVLTVNDYNLLRRNARGVYDFASERGLGVINAGERVDRY